MPKRARRCSRSCSSSGDTDGGAARQPTAREDGWRGLVTGHGDALAASPSRIACRQCAMPRADDSRRRRRAARLKITEIFLLDPGRGRTAVGWPTVFVRLTGCPLRCQYCDTAYAFYGGEWRAIEDDAGRGRRVHGTRHVCVTGGEPLAQKRCLALLTRSATPAIACRWRPAARIDIGDVDPRVARVVDMKTPGSGEVARNRCEQPRRCCAPNDAGQVRDLRRADYEWARDAACASVRSPSAAPCCSRPSYGQVEPRDLARMDPRDRLPVRLQVQLHKVLWGDDAGRSDESMPPASRRAALRRPRFRHRARASRASRAATATR